MRSRLTRSKILTPPPRDLTANAVSTFASRKRTHKRKNSMSTKCSQSQGVVCSNMKSAIGVLVDLMYEYRHADFCRDERWTLLCEVYFDVFDKQLPVAARYLLKSHWTYDPHGDFIMRSFAEKAIRVDFDAVGFWDR